MFKNRRKIAIPNKISASLPAKVLSISFELLSPKMKGFLPELNEDKEINNEIHSRFLIEF